MSPDCSSFDVPVRCWLPDKDDLVVYGRLQRTGGKLTLELFESFEDERNWNDHAVPSVICIERLDRERPKHDVKFAVATELLRTSWGMSGEIYHVGGLLWDHGTLDQACVLPPSFDLVRVVSSQLEQWLQPALLSDRIGHLPAAGGTVIVGPDRAEVARQQLGSRSLALGNKLRWMWQESSRCQAEQIVYVDCEDPAGLDLANVKQFVGHIRQWLCLVTGWPAGPVVVHLRAAGTWYELWADLVGGGGKDVRACGCHLPDRGC